VEGVPYLVNLGFYLASYHRYQFTDYRLCLPSTKQDDYKCTNYFPNRPLGNFEF